MDSKKCGHVADCTPDGQEGLLRGLSERYDLMVVDRMLPTIDGLRIVKKNRGAGVNIPVFALTARARLDDRVEGLESGGDDYLVKPFVFPPYQWRGSMRLRVVPRLPQARRD